MEEKILNDIMRTLSDIVPTSVGKLMSILGADFGTVISGIERLRKYGLVIALDDDAYLRVMEESDAQEMMKAIRRFRGKADRPMSEFIITKMIPLPAKKIMYQPSGYVEMKYKSAVDLLVKCGLYRLEGKEYYSVYGVSGAIAVFIAAYGNEEKWGSHIQSVREQWATTANSLTQSKRYSFDDFPTDADALCGMCMSENTDIVSDLDIELESDEYEDFCKWLDEYFDSDEDETNDLLGDEDADKEADEDTDEKTGEETDDAKNKAYAKQYGLDVEDVEEIRRLLTYPICVDIIEELLGKSEKKSTDKRFTPLKAILKEFMEQEGCQELFERLLQERK